MQSPTEMKQIARKHGAALFAVPAPKVAVYVPTLNGETIPHDEDAFTVAHDIVQMDTVGYEVRRVRIFIDAITGSVK